MTMPIAETWFETRSHGGDITLIFEPHVSSDVRCNMWHVRGRERDLLFDSGMGVVSLKRHVALVTEKPLLSVASHCHFDHVGGHYEFDTRLSHAAEADIMSAPDRRNTVADEYVTAEIFSAQPYSGFDASQYNIRAADRPGGERRCHRPRRPAFRSAAPARPFASIHRLVGSGERHASFGRRGL